MPTLILPTLGAAEFARIAKALSASAAHKENGAPAIVQSVLLRRTSPDVLTLTGTDRYVAVESAIKTVDASDLDAVVPEGLLVPAKDLAKVLAVTATEITSGDPVSVGVTFSGNTDTLSRKNATAEAVPGTDYRLDVPGLFPDAPSDQPLAAPVVSPDSMAVVAGMLPVEARDVPAMQNASGTNRQRIMWSWGGDVVRSRLIVMCMARATDQEES